MNAPAYNLPGITAKASNPESTPVVNSAVADTGSNRSLMIDLPKKCIV